MNRTLKTLTFWIVVVVSAMLLWQVVRAPGPKAETQQISYSQFMAEVEGGNVARVSITGSQIRGQYRGGKRSFYLTGPSDQHAVLEKLREKGVDVWFKDASTEPASLRLLGTWAPLILLAALWFFMIRQQQIRQQQKPSGEDRDPRPDAPIEPR